MITVVATAQGYYGEYRYLGDTFECEPALFSKVWMAPETKKDVAKLKEYMAKPKVAVEEEDKKEADIVAAEDLVLGTDGDALSTMDKEALITYAKANCLGLKVARNMNEDTIRERIREHSA